MNRVALAFSTKDRTELSKRTIEPLLNLDCSLYWVDGSATKEGEELPFSYVAPFKFYVRSNVRGGADTAIAYMLTDLLKTDCTHIGLVENDVLLIDPDWFNKIMALFEQGASDGLKVGAVSARCFEDRILIQRQGYAVMHNLGAGMVIFTREAAQLVLKYFRTGWTNANRLVFSQLSGIDIGSYWAFRGGQHILCADWGFDVVLAAHGLASLALTPSPVEMIGQNPPLEQQGLKIMNSSGTPRVGDAFQVYRDRTQSIRDGGFAPAWPGLFHIEPGACVIFPHQLPYVGGSYSGDWLLKWTMGFGPFAWKASTFTEWKEAGFATDERYAPCTLTVPILGSCDILSSGGKDGGKVRVVDKGSGFEASPNLKPEDSQGQVMALNVPSACGYREIELTCLSPGLTFYGIKCREAQPYNPLPSFDHSWLPPCG